MHPTSSRTATASVWLALALFSLLTAGACAAATLTPVAWWPLNQTTGATVPDTIGANTGTVVGNPLWGAGVSGNALTLDGNSYVNIPSDANNTVLNPTDTITVTGWFKTTASVTQTTSVFFHDGNYTALQLTPDGMAQTVFWNAATPHKVTFPFAGLNDGAWHHFASTYDSAAGLNIYVDGTLRAYDTVQSGSLTASTQPFILGGAGPATGLFTGSLDDVRVYNAVLGAQDISVVINQAPALNFATAYDANTVLVVFKLPVDAATARVSNNYTITASDSSVIAVNGAQISNDGTTVTLLTGTLTAGATYTVTVVNVKDAGGANVIAGNNSAPFTFVPPLAGMISWWKLDESSGQQISDAIAITHNFGTVYGTPAWGPGESGNALTLINISGGTPNIVSFGNPPTLNLTSAISVAAWFRTTQAPPSDTPVTLISHDGSFTALRLVGDGANAEVLLWPATDPTRSQAVQFPWVYNDGLWHHYAAAYSAAGLNIYVDGLLVQSDATKNFALATTTSPFYLGDDGSGTELYDGSFDEVQVFNRAVTATEVVSLMNKAPGLRGVVGLLPGTVKVTFDMPVDASTAQTAANYGISDGTHTVAVTSATLTAPNSVTLATGALTAGLPYTLTVSNVKDSTVAHAMAPNTIAPFTALAVLANTVAWWKLDETQGDVAADSSGNGNNGLVSGPPNWGPGQAGNALTFNTPLPTSGPVNAVNIINGQGLNATAAISVAAWVKTTQAAVAGAPVAVLGHYGHFSALQLSDAAAARVVLWPATPPPPPALAYDTVDFPWTYGDGHWHHFAAVYQSGTGGGVSVYVDGVAVTTDLSKQYVLATTTNNFVLGGDGQVGVSFMGSLDEVLVFSRALTANEVRTLMSSSVAPAVTSLAPTSGPIAGGQIVTLTGTSLLGVTAVTFGGLPGNAVTAATDTQVTVTTPAHAAGAVDVAVIKGSSNLTLPGGYAFVAKPKLTSVSPSGGPLAGGQTVTLTGTDLAGATAVTFGGVAGTVISSTATSVVATTPALGAPGAVAVGVVTPGGTDSLTSGYTYLLAPTITLLSPPNGAQAGGNTVTITGTNFGTAPTVTFGGTAVIPSIITDTHLVVTAPPHAPASVDIVVTALGGTVSAKYTYNGPVLTSLSPVIGGVAGGQSVTISGSSLGQVNVVTFDNLSAPITSKSAAQLVVTTPAHAAGAVNVVASNPTDGASAPLTFTYVVPSIVSVEPARGPVAGGQTVTIAGAWLASTTSVTFGGVAVSAGSITVVSDTQLTVKTPAHTAQAVAVAAVTANGTATFAGSYVYDAPPGLLSTPITAPLNPLVGHAFTVIIQTTDPEGETVSVEQYDWGGGITSTTGQHTYDTLGSHNASVTIFDGYNHVTIPFVINVIAVPPLTLSKLSGTFNFKKTGKDTYLLTGTLPNQDPGLSFANKQFTVDVSVPAVNLSDALVTFVLNAKAKAQSSVKGAGTLTLKAKFIKDPTTKQPTYVGGDLSFTAKFKGDLVGKWAIDKQSSGAQPLDLAVDVTFGVEAFTATAQPLMMAKPGKGGTFK